jgi:hypothetical protein
LIRDFTFEEHEPKKFTPPRAPSPISEAPPDLWVEAKRRAALDSPNWTDAYSKESAEYSSD